MPVNPKYNATFIPHALNGIEKCQETVMRRVDERSGDIMLFDLSQSSLQLEDNIGDADSLVSHGSHSSTQSDESARRVRFAEKLVIFERPFTAPEDKLNLHYTNEELMTFRMEYRSFLRNQHAAKRAREMKMGLFSIYNGVHGMLSSVAEAASSLVQSEIGDSPAHQEQEVDLEANAVIDTMYLF
mmetsp:Transcript_22155/g.33492  ORF Transcript_22155/g.33492 Transcript_22155/m.33492 type:complete len:185 (-) Transcript_22155:40-594(-)